VPASRPCGTCLFIPGIPGGPATWAPLAALAPDRTRLVYWPLQNWQVSGPATPAELDRLEAAVRADIDAIAGYVTLVGHSFGAWLIARMLEHCDPLTTRAVLFSGMPLISAEHRDGLQLIRKDLAVGAIETAQLDRQVQELMLGADQWTGTHAKRVGRMIDDMGLSRSSMLLGLVSHLADPAYRIRPYDVPTDVVHVMNDRAARLGSRAQLHVWPGGSHLPHWSDPETAAKLVFR